MLAKNALQLRLLSRTTRTLIRRRFAEHGRTAPFSTILAVAPRPRITCCVLRVSEYGPRRPKSIWTDAIHPVLLPPVVFVGLVVTLWTWKCMMMVFFQDKIIYMPGVPPFARSERTEDYTGLCKPVAWEVKQIKSLDGTKLAICHGSIDSGQTNSADVGCSTHRKEVVICYFQGNGGSLPPRLPMLSNILKMLASRSKERRVKYTLLALSYRGYWTSSGRPSESGISLDSQALLNYVNEHYHQSPVETKLILWGQSIGSGVATTLTAVAPSMTDSAKLPISGLIMETPFTSIRSMLAALYPQKWLPYRYLWPFLWNHWDSEAALRTIATALTRPKILLLPGSRDEVVPSVESEKLEALCEELQLDFIRKDVEGALHNEASTKRPGQLAIVDFIAGRHRGSR